MPRKIIVRSSNHTFPVLEEQLADNEAQLQALVKDHPELIAVEELGLTGPMMVVGRETSLPSGAIDLVGVARSGDIVLVEFKTGPQNPDFRSALAQLLDYGSDLWKMTYEQFEQTVAARYFAGSYCLDTRYRGGTSISAAARIAWPEISEEELAQIQERLGQQLATGSFCYVVAAQRFTPTIERGIDYLNATMKARFFGVELVRFVGEGLSAFESRTTIKPPRRNDQPQTTINESEFLANIADDEYRDAVHEILDTCRGLNYRFEWGTAGLSIRVPTQDRPEPLTVAWLFPPGKAGWMGLTNLTLGVDPWSADRCPSARPAIDAYLAAARELPHAIPTTRGKLEAIALSSQATIANKTAVIEVLSSLMTAVSGGS